MTDVDIQSDLNREAQEVKRYLKARMEWDDRYGSARTQALNWRYLAFLLAGLLVLAFLGLIYLGTLPKQAIHIVETDKLGQAVYRGLVGVDADHYQIPDASKQYHLRRFIDNVRSLPADTVVVKQQWEDAYALLSPAAANVLSDYARKDPPTERMQNQRVTLGNITLTLFLLIRGVRNGRKPPGISVEGIRVPRSGKVFLILSSKCPLPKRSYALIQLVCISTPLAGQRSSNARPKRLGF